MNYKIIDEQKFVRICLKNFSEQLTLVNDSFRIIILIDKKFMISVDMKFLSRLEKIQISFSDLLDDKQKLLIKNILEEIKLKDYVKDYSKDDEGKNKKSKKINYDLNYLLINCSEQEIGGLVYNSFIYNKNENINTDEIKQKVYSKISNMLSQDIITILPDNNIIKQKYYSEKKYYNFKQYINDLGTSRTKNENTYKISIIYTFSSIANTIDEYSDTDMAFMISEIRTEKQLGDTIDEIKSRNVNNGETNKYIILIHFE